MNVIATRTIRQYQDGYPDAATALDAWLEVARETGIPRSTITNVLSGRRQISKENVTRLATYFRVDPSVFLPE